MDMAKRIVVFVFGLGLLGWVIYAFWSIVDVNPKESYLSYFGKEDQNIIAIHHPNDFQLGEMGVNCNANNLKLYASLQAKLPKPNTVYLSASRNFIVISLSEKWNFSKIRMVFQNGIFPFEKTGPNTFTFGRYLGKFKGNQLALSYYDLTLAKETNVEWKVDPQASFSIVFLSKDLEVRDVYVKSEKRITYSTLQSRKKNLSPLVDDRSCFGEFIPSAAARYTFFEKKYLSYTDEIFAKSPLFGIVKTGIVLFEFNQKKILLFDLKDENELVPYLNDYFHLKEENQERSDFPLFKICEMLSSDLEGSENTDTTFSVASLNGMGFLATKSSDLDAVLLELEMRKSIATDLKKYDWLNENLPQKVSYRHTRQGKAESVGWINNQFFGIKVEKSGLEKADEETNNAKSYFTMNPGEAVVSYCALSGRGNVVIECQKNIYGYKNGSQKWKKPIEEALLFPPTVLATKNAEQENIALHFPTEIQVIDKMGRETFSIPSNYFLPLESCVLQNKPALICTKKSELVLISGENGKVIRRISMPEEIEEIFPGELNGKAVCGILTKSKCYLVDLTNGKRTALKVERSQCLGFTESGQCLLKGPKGMQLMDGKQTIDAQVTVDWHYVGDFTLKGETGQLFQYQNSLACLVTGKVRWKKTYSTQEISAVHILKTFNQISTLAMLDALENKVYLLDTYGKEIDMEERPGQREVQISPFGNNGCSITTYLSQFLIQYNQ